MPGNIQSCSSWNTCFGLSLGHPTGSLGADIVQEIQGELPGRGEGEGDMTGSQAKQL